MQLLSLGINMGNDGCQMLDLRPFEELSSCIQVRSEISTCMWGWEGLEAADAFHGWCVVRSCTHLMLLVIWR